MLHPQKSHLYTSKDMGSKTSVRICFNVNGSQSLQLRIPMGNSSAFFSAPAAEHRVKIAAAVTRSGSWVLDPWLIFNTFGVQNWFSHDFFWFDQTAFLSPRTIRSFFALPDHSANSRLNSRCSGFLEKNYGERITVDFLLSVMVGMHSVRSL